MWKSVIRDYPEDQDEQGNFNPMFGEWVETLVEEPWLVAMRDLVKWSGTWTGTEEELMEEIRLRVNREVWESEDFPSGFPKLRKYFQIAWQVSIVNGAQLNLEMFDYHEVKKDKDLEEFCVPGWGPEAPILVEQGSAGRRPSYRRALYTLLYKYRSPLPLAVLNFTYFGGKFTKKNRSWSGSSKDLVEALMEGYNWPGEVIPTPCPAVPPTPEDPEGKEAERLFDEVWDKLEGLWDPSGYRWLHGQMRTCAYMVEDVGIKVSWKKEPTTVTDSEGNPRSTKRTRWSIEAPYWKD
jgi:hypothetical protein